MWLIIALIVFQILIFIALVLVFRQIMTRNVVSATQHLDQMNQEYVHKEEAMDKQLEEVKLKTEEMITQAQEEAEKTKIQIITDAETERDKLLKHAHTQSKDIIDQADKSRQALLGEIEQRIKQEAIKKAGELLQEILPEDFRQEVHARWIGELIDAGFGQIQDVQLPADPAEAKVISAFPLKDEERKTITSRLRKVLGQDIVVQEETDSALVAGIVITIGSLILDGSLKNKIKEKMQKNA